MKSNKTNFYLILPYLKTSKPFEIRGVQFHNSLGIDSFPKEVKQHIKTLTSMFFLRDNLRIKQMACAHVEIEDKVQNEKTLIRTVKEINNLLGFLYSAPHPQFLDIFLPRENTNLFLFSPNRVSQYLVNFDYNVVKIANNPKLITDERGEVEGYNGSVNGGKTFSVAKGCRIYPSSLNIVLNLSQDLFQDLNRFLTSHGKQSLINIFLKPSDPPLEIEKRIFTALKWYNKSNSILSDDDESLVNLAIAFESLLGLEGSNQITKRFKNAVALLVGPVDKLDDWLDQFYNARSKIVHEGKTENIRFVSLRKGKTQFNYRPLNSYGRIIFRICLNAILTGAEMARKVGLSGLLKTNKERFIKISEILRKKDKNPIDLIKSVSHQVTEISDYRFVYEEGLTVDEMIHCVKLLIKTVLRSKIPVSQNLKDSLEKLSDENSKDTLNNLKLVKEINELLDEEKKQFNFDFFGPIWTLSSLIDSIWNYSFMVYYQLEREKKSKK
ncbi:MAG: hypothetical protein KAX05_13680 [Bacteroidales bacterium]|nr:hypothetical protein [Bacteroidales bacterium]